MTPGDNVKGRWRRLPQPTAWHAWTWTALHDVILANPLSMYTSVGGIALPGLPTPAPSYCYCCYYDIHDDYDDGAGYLYTSTTTVSPAGLRGTWPTQALTTFAGRPRPPLRRTSQAPHSPFLQL